MNRNRLINLKSRREIRRKKTHIQHAKKDFKIWKKIQKKYSSIYKKMSYLKYSVNDI